MRPRTRWSAPFRSPIALSLLLAGLTACTDRGDRQGEAQAGEEPQYGGTAVVAGGNDIEVANPLLSAEAKSQEINQYLLFTTLVRYDEELGFEPYLAESWELEDDGVVFHLRDDVLWHDGVKTTAHDVAFTFERAKDPATAYPNADYFERWTGVEVVDSFTVRFTFEPHADPLASWTFAPIAPAHLLDSIPAARLREAAFNTKPVGNGPFRFASRAPNDRWVFEANPDFPEELGGRPYLDRIVWRVIPENAAQAAELRAGNVDLALVPGADNFKQLDSLPGLEGIVRQGRQFAFVGWNGRRPPFDDARVRHALTLAMNRRQIIDGLRNGYGQLGTSPIGAFHWAYNDDLEPLPHDPERARAVLAEAGFRDADGDGVLEGPDGEPFAFELKYQAGNKFNENMAELIRADLERIGVEVTPRATEFGTLIQDISTPPRRFDAVIMGWNSDFRINLRDLFHSAEREGMFQLAAYANPEVDRLIERTATEPDRDEARPLYHRLQEILHEEQPWTVLYYFPELIVKRERLRGTEMDIRGVFVNAPRWWLAGASPAQP